MFRANKGWNVVGREGAGVGCLPWVENLSRRSSRPGQHFEILPQFAHQSTHPCNYAAVARAASLGGCIKRWERRIIEPRS